jgi:hypothetical protein
MILIDSSNQLYSAIETISGQVRVIKIEHGWAGEPCIRMQIQDESNHLRFGPDIPMSCLSKVIEAMKALGHTTSST